MKRSVIAVLVTVFALIPLQLSAQNKMTVQADVKGKQQRKIHDEEYNQSKARWIKAYYAQLAQRLAFQPRTAQAQTPVGVNPGGITQSGIINTSILRNRFGVESFFTHRLSPNLFIVGEVGYFYASSNNANPTLYDRLVGLGNYRDVYSATIIPLYGGLRRGLLLNNSMKRFYPYVGAGLGPVLGMGYMRNDLGTNRSFQLAPSVYAMVGSEIYATSKWFLDLSVRYRHLTFAQPLANWKDFSGFSFNFGFGYGIGQMILR